VCEHYACKQPATSAQQLREQLDEVLTQRAAVM
jgi:hypothetical protein